MRFPTTEIIRNCLKQIPIESWVEVWIEMDGPDSIGSESKYRTPIRGSLVVVDLAEDSYLILVNNGIELRIPLTKIYSIVRKY